MLAAHAKGIGRLRERHAVVFIHPNGIPAPFNGTDVLAKIQFRGVMTGVSAVSFSYIELSTNNGFVLSHVAQGGQIRVGALKRMWLPSIRR